MVYIMELTWDLTSSADHWDSKIIMGILQWFYGIQWIQWLGNPRTKWIYVMEVCLRIVHKWGIVHCLVFLQEGDERGDVRLFHKQEFASAGCR